MNEQKLITFAEVKIGQTISLIKDPFAIYIRLPDTKKGNSRFQPLNYKGEQRGNWVRFCSRWKCRLLETEAEIQQAIAAKFSQYDRN